MRSYQRKRKGEKDQSTQRIGEKDYSFIDDGDGIITLFDVV